MTDKWSCRLLTALLAASAMLFGCSSETESRSERGQVRLPLVSETPAGVSYGLFGDLRIEGPESFFEFAHPENEVLVREVAAGIYEVEIMPGFALLNLDTGEFEERAQLLSANPAIVEVPAYGFGSVTFTFAVPGGEVSFNTGTLGVDLVVVEGLPEGSACTVDADCASAVCTGGVCGSAPEPDLLGTLSCELPLGLGRGDLGLALGVVPGVPTPFGVFDLGLEARIQVSDELGELLLGLGSNVLEVTRVEAVIAAAGTSEGSFVVESGPVVLDLDRDGDGVADRELSFAVPVDSPSLYSEEDVLFTVEQLEFQLVLPLFGAATISEAFPPSVFDCNLLSDSFALPVEPPVEPLPDGASCLEDSQCISGLCTEGICGPGTEPLCSLAAPAPDPSEPCGGGSCTPLSGTEVYASIYCELPIGLGETSVDVSLSIAPQTQLTVEQEVELGLEASTVIPASLGQLLVGLGTDQLNIASIQADLAVQGAEPSPISFSLGAASLDVDLDDDGLAEEVTLIIPIDPTQVTAECTEQVSFSISRFEALLTGVPLLGELVVSSDSLPGNTLPCFLSSSTLSFPVHTP